MWQIICPPLSITAGLYILFGSNSRTSEKQHYQHHQTLTRIRIWPTDMGKAMIKTVQLRMQSMPFLHYSVIKNSSIVSIYISMLSDLQWTLVNSSSCCYWISCSDITGSRVLRAMGKKILECEFQSQRAANVKLNRSSTAQKCHRAFNEGQSRESLSISQAEHAQSSLMPEEETSWESSLSLSQVFRRKAGHEGKSLINVSLNQLCGFHDSPKWEAAIKCQQASTNDKTLCRNK